MKRLALFVLIGVACTGCERATKTDSVGAKPNNTAVNVRDRADDVKTPIDQNENQADVNVTANIRKKVVDTKMSVDAQNVKIITQDGRVTLRGPVKSVDEKERIEGFAHAVAGADKVDSQLEIAK